MHRVKQSCPWQALKCVDHSDQRTARDGHSWASTHNVTLEVVAKPHLSSLLHPGCQGPCACAGGAGAAAGPDAGGASPPRTTSVPVPATPAGASAAAGPLKATSAPAAVPEDVCGEAMEQARAEGRGAEPGKGLGSGSGHEDYGRSSTEGPAPAVVSLGQLHEGDLPRALEGPAAALPAPRGRGAAGAGVAGWSPDVGRAGRREPERAPGRAAPDQAPAGPSSAASAASSSTMEPHAAGALDRNRLPQRAPGRQAAPVGSAADPRSAEEAESAAGYGGGRHEQAALRSGQEVKPLRNGPLEPPPAPAAWPSGSAASSASHAAGGTAGPVQERKQDATELDRRIPANACCLYVILP